MGSAVVSKFPVLIICDLEWTGWFLLPQQHTSLHPLCAQSHGHPRSPSEDGTGEVGRVQREDHPSAL